MNIAPSILYGALQTLTGAPATEPPGDAGRPPTIQATNESGSPEVEPAHESASTRDCIFWARAHAGLCTNAIDGTPSILSNNLCADGCGNTYEEAAYAAALSLSVQTCLGPAWGCCLYYVDMNFNTCGG
ncbi:hypothetical protein OV203_49875 [Nannocystis sp. ILAH1]|uniref:hypothetical protein n=1 Tax=unclassified Nannocystis TaxID=2627009 RepID=UPI002271B88F|nr:MULTISPECIES: hypothetical protein [unclassified Nannocystis]MCY0995335.1 hypothetical protein [Nannocystis sp. ILAH1]MCY1065160.1 hypothetical protein [Nannocystis sp. RBIL2]